MKSTNKILLIGASGGIGSKTKEVLQEADFNVVTVGYKNTDKLSHHVDLKNIHSLKNLHTSLINEKFYAIINCAGIVKFEGKNFEEDFEIWDETIAVNLSSNFYLAKLFYANLLKNGRFIMISSTDAYYGGGITASYAASKAGVNSLTKSLSLSLQDKKIRVNSIAPGWVSTPMIEGNSASFYSKLGETNPLKRIANPLDIANLIKFLLSKDSDYINGQVITVDGGYTNQDPTLLIEEETK